MSREAHVRFCESVGVRFPHATRLFVERLWRSIKYEEVYLKAYQTVLEARVGINAYLEFYNRRRPHLAIGLTQVRGKQTTLFYTLVLRQSAPILD